MNSAVGIKVLKTLIVLINIEGPPKFSESGAPIKRIFVKFYHFDKFKLDRSILRTMYDQYRAMALI